jgi:hypothetical protein
MRETGGETMTNKSKQKTRELFDISMAEENVLQ